MRIAIYNWSYEYLGGAERRTAALAAHLAEKHDVTIVSTTELPKEKILKLFGIDLSRVHALSHPSWGKKRRHFRGYDVFINNAHRNGIKNRAPIGIFSCMFPTGKRPNLSSYNLITANSSYTAHWIKRLWDYDSRVVYSACQDMGPPDKKKNIIANIGFMHDDGSGFGRKNQMRMLDVFLDLVRGGLTGWELHLLGNTGPKRKDAAFVAALRAKAEGHPVRIETGLDFSELQQRLRQARLYWHAMGYGKDPEKDPYDFEHFGMSVVEAMSAGAVPIALNGGGPSEVIRHGVDGYLWSSLDELRSFSLKLADDQRLAATLSESAVERAKSFNVASYLRKMDEIIETASPRPWWQRLL